MDWVKIISTLGFPIAAVLAMGIFIFRIYVDMRKEKEVARAENAANMEKVQARCKEREEKLYEEIAKNREINAQAIQTISNYAAKLDSIQQDIKEIKTDITVIMSNH